MSEKEQMITAYHEGGHALVAAALPGTDPVHKVTILPRGRALGYTMVLPDEDKYSQTRSEMLDKLAYMMGGRAAEEMVFHDPTTGAGNDIEKATVAGPRDGHPVRHDRAARRDQARRGAAASRSSAATWATQRNYSEDVAAIVDEETKKLLATAHQEAFDILEENRDVLDSLVLALMEKETLDKAEVAEVFEPLRRRPARPAWTGSPDRNPSSIPPVRDPREDPRRRPPSGAIADESEGAVVLTPPGAGGDVHGDPGLGPTPPSPPTPAARATSRDARTAAMGVNPIGEGHGAIATFDHDRAAAAVRELLIAIGEDPEREGLQDTPARVARAYAELTSGLHQTPEEVLTTTFDIGHDEMVLVRDIELWSMCEHHLVPFTGVAHVGYIPNENGKITGLSKLARLVDVYAKRPQVQERLTTQVADALVELLEPRGVIVVIEAEHLCMTMRGVRKAGARTITSAVRGIMHKPATRAEAMSPDQRGAQPPLSRSPHDRHGSRGAPACRAAPAPGHGRRQRHPRLVLRRRPLRHHRRRHRPRARAARPGRRPARHRRRVHPARRHPSAGRRGARPGRAGDPGAGRGRDRRLGGHDAPRGRPGRPRGRGRAGQRRVRRPGRPADPRRRGRRAVRRTS